ncbi:hypothetical protein [Sinosporangium siamense]|uniref:hypothetical protein n=1 Tax=Sinosporangium siamense TaxID=1367973 RepID=UPI001950C9BD|nr:hypothetical protein [Sinosporangium siamense]
MLVQVVACLLGAGLGLLIGSALVAFTATVVLPMGLWVVLGTVEALAPAQGWLTPYSAVRNPLSGQMSAIMWAQWIVVFLLWGVALNAAGILWRKRRSFAREG